MALLTMVELAAELGVHPNTVWNDFKRQRIPGERIGRLLRFDLQAVRQAMRERARATPVSGERGDARIGASRPRGGTASPPDRPAETQKVARARRPA